MAASAIQSDRASASIGRVEKHDTAGRSGARRRLGRIAGNDSDVACLAQSLRIRADGGAGLGVAFDEQCMIGAAGQHL